MDKEEEKIDVTLDEKEIQEEKNEDINFNFLTFVKENKKPFIIFIIAIFSLIVIINLVSFLFGKELAKTNLEKFIKVDELMPDIFYDGTVCIDPGHGGEVPITAPDLQEKEKDDVLKLSLLLKDKLKDKHVKVVMTREDDSSVELEERTQIANDNNVDLFLSIHRNISDSGSDINGIEVWLAYDKDETSDIYGENIHDALLNSHIQNDRGIRYGSMTNPKENYKVNGLTTMPSCLVELGFMTNDIDNELYDTYMDEYASNLCEAICKTLEYIDQNK